MTLTLLLSFFAISGYVSNSPLNNNKVSSTEVLAAGPNTLNHSMSYKRASTLLYKEQPFGFIRHEHFDQTVLLYNRLDAGRYKYLKQRFSLTKRTINYPTLHLYYAADQHKTVPSFQMV